MALDLFSFPKDTGAADVFYFVGTSDNQGLEWMVWEKPRGKTMIDILLVGRGGGGGLGIATGAASTAGGGGGGGSGAQTRLTMPLALLPDRLYISLAGPNGISTLASYITVSPKLLAGAGAPIANDVLMIANGGGPGSNASAGTGGGGGTGGVNATAQFMPLGWAYSRVLVGQPGVAGSNNTAATALVLPLTGLLVTGGGGGSGLGAAATSNPGGGITGAGMFPTVSGGVASTGATVPPNNGFAGFKPVAGLVYYYGGTGGASTWGNATGTGLVQSSGGNGAPGCGGGGAGGALTGSTTPPPALGGPAFCVITVW